MQIMEALFCSLIVCILHNLSYRLVQIFEEGESDDECPLPMEEVFVLLGLLDQEEL